MVYVVQQFHIIGPSTMNMIFYLTSLLFSHFLSFPVQVSALTDQAGMQDVGANSGDFDDDEGGGLVS